MITAIHTLVYSDDPTATRAFLKDVLRWPFVSEGARGDAGVGGAGTGGDDPADWLIFATGPSELGVHPTFEVYEGREWQAPRRDRVGARRSRRGVHRPGAGDGIRTRDHAARPGG